MSSRGIYGQITDGLGHSTDCLVIGEGVPRIHLGDSVPVYLVVEHDDGIPIVQKDGRLKNMLAYPSHFPGPGRCSGEDWLFADHERLPWKALIPCFDEE